MQHNRENDIDQENYFKKPLKAVQKIFKEDEKKVSNY